MPHLSDREKPSAVDFATRTLFEPAADPARDECERTLRELVSEFGLAAVVRSLPDAGVQQADEGNERVMQALRGLCVLILESDRPKLTAQLVGKLVHLELATGKRIHLRELGRLNHISKQAVSNRLKHLAARLNLPRPDSLPINRRSHRLMNRRNYGQRTFPTGADIRDATPAD